jgi:hypothetical protein
VKRAQSSDDLPSDETTKSEIPLAKKAAEGKANKNNSPESSMELVEALPSVPRGHQVVRKCKANVVGCLLCLCCSPSSSPPEPKRRKVVGTAFAGDDVPAGGSAETAGTDPSITSAGIMTITVVGTSSRHLVPSAGVTPPPVMSTVVVKPRVLRLKKPAMKKSSL